MQSYWTMLLSLRAIFSGHINGRFSVGEMACKMIEMWIDGEKSTELWPHFSQKVMMMMSLASNLYFVWLKLME